MEQKREAEIKRRQLIEQYNTDIQSQVRRLNLEGQSLTPELRTEIERKIQENKAMLNSLLSEQKVAQAKFREEKSAAAGGTTAQQAPATAPSAPVQHHH